MSEEPFMEYVRRQKRKKKAGFKQRKKPLAYERKAELEQHLNRILPEPEPKPFEGKPISNFKASWKQDGEVKILKQKNMQMLTYEVRKNPSIIFLFSLASAKIYYDIEKDYYFLYVFSPDRRRIVRKIRLEKHDMLWLLAFALYDRYDEKIPKTLYINRKIRARMLKIIEREKQHYTSRAAECRFLPKSTEEVGIENDPF